MFLWFHGPSFYIPIDVARVEDSNVVVVKTPTVSTRDVITKFGEAVITIVVTKCKEFKVA